MVMKNKRIGYLTQHLVLLILIFLGSVAQAQTITIAPTSPAGLGFTSACSSPTFNTFTVNVTLAPSASFPATTTFTIQLSDTAGNFVTTTTIPATIVTSTTTTRKLSFSFPTTLVGSELYKLKVVANTGASTFTSNASNVFPAYYKSQDLGYTINTNLSTATFCVGSSVTLSIDNPTSPVSPAFYSNLTYLWYKDGVLITGPGSNGTSYIVSTIGKYKVVTNYGTCTASSISFSNEVTVSSIGGGAIPNITSSGGTEVCFGSTNLDVPSGFTTYKWFLNGTLIPLATTRTYVASQPGSYTAELSNSSCAVTTPAIVLKPVVISASVNVPSTSVIYPGETKTITATTSGLVPTFQWFLNGTAITGAVSSSYNATEAGNYKVQITQTSGCVTSVEVPFVLENPINYSLAINSSTSYTACNNTTVKLDISNFTANLIGGSSASVLSQTNIGTYQWYKDNIMLIGQNANTITVTSALGSGMYKLIINFTNGTTTSVTSPDFKIVLKPDPLTEFVNISTTDTVLCIVGDTRTLFSNVSIPVTGMTYTWFKDGSILPSATAANLTTSDLGIYKVVVKYNSCDITSNDITLTPFNAGGVTVDKPKKIILAQGGSVTINATAPAGATYVWNSNGLFVSTTNSATFTNEGTATLTVSFPGVSCNVIKEFEIVYSSALNIPNVISPNNDGVNDTWSIPSDFLSADTEITILNSSGEIMLQTKDYLNNWPDTDIDYQAINPVYYYIIRKQSVDIKKGSITIVK
jgi:gliding motility-associated-like protein